MQIQDQYQDQVQYIDQLDPYPNGLNQKKVCKCKCMFSKKVKLILLICFFCFMFFLLLFCLIKLTESNNEPSDPNAVMCTILQNDNLRPYPPLNQSKSKGKPSYFIQFNRTLMQADFVKYIQPSTTSSCWSCYYFKKDPYGIDVLSHDDYTNTGFDRGHLVPNADYGSDTYIISNAVPMQPKFNQGSWRKSEEFIRRNYRGLLILKGCEYGEKFLMSGKKNKLFIPMGCFFVVFNTSNYNQTTGLQLLDYGYLENKNISSLIVKKMPQWIKCKNDH